MTETNSAQAGLPDADLAVKVTELFDQMINPMLASHGGFVNLVKVENGNVYVELGGGCRGCSGARMTLKMGVEKALREKIPGMTGQVIDATDHGC